MLRFQVTIPNKTGYSDQAIKTFLLDQIHVEVSGEASVLILAPDEVIGNKAEFMQAVQEAADKIKPVVITDDADKIPVKDYLRVCSQRVAALVALREACDRLYHFSMAIESKKLKKFIDRLFEVYKDNSN